MQTLNVRLIYLKWIIATTLEEFAITIDVYTDILFSFPGYLSIPKGKIDGSHVSKPCKLSLLKDVAPCDQEEYDIPTDAVSFLSIALICSAEGTCLLITQSIHY